MDLWQLWLLIGVIILIVDMFTTTLFLVNISLAFFLTAIVAYFGGNIFWQMGVLLVFSSLFLVFLRPLLIRKLKTGETKSADDMYVGQAAKVIEKTDNLSGRIAVYGEEWHAKSKDNQVFEVNENVKIIAQDGLIMIVDKI